VPAGAPRVGRATAAHLKHRGGMDVFCAFIFAGNGRYVARLRIVIAFNDAGVCRLFSSARILNWRW